MMYTMIPNLMECWIARMGISISSTSLREIASFSVIAVWGSWMSPIAISLSHLMMSPNHIWPISQGVSLPCPSIVRWWSRMMLTTTSIKLTFCWIIRIIGLVFCSTVTREPGTNYLSMDISFWQRWMHVFWWEWLFILRFGRSNSRGGGWDSPFDGRLCWLLCL